MDTAIATGRPDEDRCGGGDDDDDDDDDDQGDDLGTPTSLAFTKTGDLVVFYPRSRRSSCASPPARPRLIALTGERALDAGRAVFHTQTSIGLACASCHPEGREDGLVWDFASSASAARRASRATSCSARRITGTAT